jgi:hypothetical protein
MNTGIALSLGAGFACMIGACASQPPPNAQAAKTEQLQCSDNPTEEDQYDLALIQSMAVIKSQPLYSLVNTMYVQPEARVNGATLVVQAPPGVSTERMTRALQCHSARAELGQANGAPYGDDPFVLPGAWLSIHVLDNRQGAYAVTIAANNIDNGLKVLRNANTFTVNRGGRVDNKCVPWPTANPEMSCVEPGSVLQ